MTAGCSIFLCKLAPHGIGAAMRRVHNLACCLVLKQKRFRGSGCTWGTHACFHTRPSSSHKLCACRNTTSHRFFCTEPWELDYEVGGQFR